MSELTCLCVFRVAEAKLDWVFSRTDYVTRHGNIPGKHDNTKLYVSLLENEVVKVTGFIYS